MDTLKKRVASRLPDSLSIATLSPEDLVGYTSFSAASPDMQDILVNLCGYDTCITIPGFELFSVEFLQGLAGRIYDYINVMTDVTLQDSSVNASIFTLMQDDATLMDDNTWWNWYTHSPGIGSIQPIISVPDNATTNTAIQLTIFLYTLSSYMKSPQNMLLPASYLIQEIRRILTSSTSTLSDIDKFINRCYLIDPTFYSKCNVVDSVSHGQLLLTQTTPMYSAFQMKAVFGFTSLKTIIADYINSQSQSLTVSSPPYNILFNTFQNIENLDTESWVSWVKLLQPYMVPDSSSPKYAEYKAPDKLTSVTATALIRSTFCKQSDCDPNNYAADAKALRDDLENNKTSDKLIYDSNVAKVIIGAIVICVAILLQKRINPPLIYTINVLVAILLVTIAVFFINKYTTMLI